jgi:hypothetical protein
MKKESYIIKITINVNTHDLKKLNYNYTTEITLIRCFYFKIFRYHLIPFFWNVHSDFFVILKRKIEKISFEEQWRSDPVNPRLQACAMDLVLETELFPNLIEI